MSRKLTKEEFIAKAIEKHGDKYDYSLVEEYKGNKVKVPIVCKEHGVFMQRPVDHLFGYGCPNCKHSRKVTTEEWIEMACKVHNDEYTYEHADYKGANEKITVTCKRHGDFSLKANNHLIGNGCNKCRLEGIKHEVTLLPQRKLSTKKHTQEEVIDKIKTIHGDKYNTEYVCYKTVMDKIHLVCNEKDEDGNIHGDFYILPHHLFRGQGCPKCGKNYRLTTEDFIEKARKVHGDKYDYSKVDYVRTHDNVTIICPIHGEFQQMPSNHLKGEGCLKCCESSLEKYISDKLNENDIKFVAQKRFKWLGRKSIDFYLPEYNIAIECQGIQHFEPVSFSGKTGNKQEKFEYITKNDNEKRKLCEENGVKLYYYSNLGIEYPYQVYEDFDILLDAIKQNIKSEIVN